MTINWGALGLVAAVTLAATLAIVGLFSLGVAALTSAQRARVGPAGTVTTVAGYACLAISALIAVYGLYLIIPQFH
ncbi:MAG TPA: hypothetical protein VIJ00_00070 [Nakamurella sp.]